MQSAKLLLLTATVSLGITSASCNTVPDVMGCSELARGILTTDTEHATIGASGDPLIDWQLYGTAETGQTNKANDRARTGFGVINQCETRDAEIRAHIERPWYRRLLPG